MDIETIGTVMVVLILVLFFGGIIIACLTTIDYSDIESQVKVLEVGKRYFAFTFGEQYYIRIQNAYSDQFTSSSEAWETCINKEQLQQFKQVKDSKQAINIRVKGMGFSFTWQCLTGDKAVIEEGE